jgi:hypothetical protein
MKKYDLTIVIPGIRPDKWLNIYNQLSQAVVNHSFQLICVGPKLPPQELENYNNFIYVRDFGSPSRCFQIGAKLALGKFIAFIPDDCVLEIGAFSDAIDLLSSKQIIDGLTLLYSEGPNYTGVQHLQNEYWVAHTHPDLRFKKVEPNWRIAPLFMYETSYFNELGGLDCRFEHINMNTHDLAFRVQQNGGILYPSPRKILSANWEPWDNNNKSPVQLAYELNDKPLFESVYSADYPIKVGIDFDNWKKWAEPFWKRRYK